MMEAPAYALVFVLHAAIVGGVAITLWVANPQLSRYIFVFIG